MDFRYVFAAGYRYRRRRARCGCRYGVSTDTRWSTIDFHIRRHKHCGQGDWEHVGHTGSGDERAACGEDAHARGSFKFFLVRMGSLSTTYTNLPTLSMTLIMDMRIKSSGAPMALSADGKIHYIQSCG